MCGIFGIAVGKDASLDRTHYAALLERLYVLSESRGKESSGLHLLIPEEGLAWRIKGAVPAGELLKSAEFRQTFASVLDRVYGEYPSRPGKSLLALAHSRLVTNGRAEQPENNQPVRYGDVTIVHNGIIVNADRLWEEHGQLHRHAEVDTEVIAALLDEAMSADGDPEASMRSVFSKLTGAASIAWTCGSTAALSLATNTGDLFLSRTRDGRAVTFGSELFILNSALDRSSNGDSWEEVRQLEPGERLTLHVAEPLPAGEVEPVVERDSAANHRDCNRDRKTVVNHDIEVPRKTGAPMLCTTDADVKLLRYSPTAVASLRRCSRCVLPETFPFISFDSNGVCNYCRGYQTKFAESRREQVKAKFLDMVAGCRSKDGRPDVIVPFSGGRDSCYGLHLIKTEFRLNPITFTYDWGMVTDLARRNIARMCGELGVQNILVSADIRNKRDNIRKNVSAWLKRPDLGVVPLFMAGDKQFHTKLSELKRQTGLRLNIWSVNPLENTDFKVGLCGVKPRFDKQLVDQLSVADKIRLLAYYGKAVVVNPRYLNSSLQDTASAYFSYYLEPRKDYVSLFHHLVWDEAVVNRVICERYGFERATDSPSTWRIGDGTAPFYNYIYMTAKGFSEFDTFRSNQIREGQIGRAEALAAILEENRPRVDGLRWYLETIGIEFNEAIRAVNRLDVSGLHA